MSPIFTFTQIDKTQIATVGGKGANLGELVNAGLPIPDGFVVGTQAYNEFVDANGLQSQILEQLESVSQTDPQSSQNASEQIQKLFLDGSVSDLLIEDLKLAYAQLVNGADDAVAVRSSATAEDLPSASFAGQQDTFLNIRGEIALIEAVKMCWASLWTARAIAYRMRQGIAPKSVSLAVVVQKLVPAESSGILFTANPTNGDRDEILINATWGLGEAIVSGQVTPDTAVVQKSTHSIISQDIATKTIMTVQTDDGTEEQPVPDELQNKEVLKGDTAVKLTKLGIQIEEHYGIPMDIEWAIVDSEIAILQARPITALPAAPLKNVVWQPPAPNTIWMRRQIVEHMPEPLSPLFEDLYLDKGMDAAISHLMKGMGRIINGEFDIDEMMPYGFTKTINGYAYTTGSFKMTPSLFWSVLRIYARILKFLKMPEFDYDGFVLPNYHSIISSWRSESVEEMDDESLLQGVAELAAADISYWFGSAANLGLSRSLDSFFDRLLKSFLFRFSLPKPTPGSSSFLRGFDSKALDAQDDMEILANKITQSDILRALIIKTPAEQLLSALASEPEAQPIVTGIEAYLEKYGHQIYNLDFVAPTQNEDPLPLLLSLKAIVEYPPEQDVRSRQKQMAQDRDALVENTIKKLNPISRQLFKWIWKWTKQYAPYRETVMFYLGSAWPTARNLAFALGQRLTNVQLLSQPDDIYYLTREEIQQLIGLRANGEATQSFAQLSQTRRALRDSRKLLTPLPIVPEGASLKIGPIKLSMFEPTPNDENNDGSRLSGFPVSTGTVTAPASVIYSIEEFDQMKPNTILVCTTTTPAWTPLFSQAVGLVTDVGGALAHGSIVAREYGIPAVMGTGVATERIKSGMMLSIDGDTGTVTLLDEEDS